MRIKILVIAIAIISLLAVPMLSACNKGADELRIALDIEDKGRYDALFDSFTAKTGIKIYATYGEDIGKLVGTKDEPDIIKTSTVAARAMQDSLIDLAPLIKADGAFSTSDYLDSVMSALVIDGKVAAIPTSINTSLLYYNKALFDESADALREAFGLAEGESVYPRRGWTYSDFRKAGVVLSEFTNNPDGTRTYTRFGAEAQFNWWGEWLVYVNQMGGTFYQPDSGNRVSAVNSPEALAATEFFVKKSMGGENEKFAPNASEAQGPYSFLAGNVAMILGGHMGDWHSYNALGLDWDVQILPVPDGKEGAVGGEIAADAFGISVRSKKTTEAFKFLKMWTGEEGALEMFKHGKIGALKNLRGLIEALPQSEQIDIDMSAVFDAVDIAVTLPDEKDFSKVMREIVMGELYRLMLTGKAGTADVSGVLNLIKTKVDNYYKGLYS